MSTFSIKDDMDNTLALDGHPRRIVSLVPSLTETLARMGAAEKLVGITKYCIHPEGEVEEPTRVGGTKNPDIPKILALVPDLVIANAEENEKPHIEELRKRVRVFVTYPRTVQGALKTVKDLGRITGNEAITESWTAECNNLLRSLPSSPPSATLTSACLIWRNPWMVAGADTYISDLLRISGLVNAFSDPKARYPKINLAKLVELKPEVLLLPDEPYRFSRDDKGELEKVFRDAKLKPRILLVDGTMLTWFGWRTQDALRYFQRLQAEWN